MRETESFVYIPGVFEVDPHTVAQDTPLPHLFLVPSQQVKSKGRE
jgi:hypothetical protein